MNRLSIKPVTNPPAIIHILHAAFQRYKTDPIPSSALAETTETIKADLKKGIDIFGAYLNEELVGIMKVTQKKNALYFSRLSVPPAFQNRGIATALVKHLDMLSSERGTVFIQCKVRKSEQDNIRLYEKLGFQIISEEITMSPTGFAIETVTMEKKA